MTFFDLLAAARQWSARECGRSKCDLLGLHRARPFPVLSWRRLKKLLAPLQHHLRGLIRGPSSQKLLKENPGADEIPRAIRCEA
jgi:hypothetical protein